MAPLTLDTFPPETVQDMIDHTRQTLADCSEALCDTEELVERECPGLPQPLNPFDFAASFPYEAELLSDAQIAFDDALAVHGEWTA
jgi:ABC-type nitrate/sulfonate/bicarbonate transport system substrate-binding protein